MYKYLRIVLFFKVTFAAIQFQKHYTLFGYPSPSFQVSPNGPSWD